MTLTGWSDDVATALVVSAGISILTCLWVLLVLLFAKRPRKKTAQSTRFIIHLAIVNLGYAVYWALPRWHSSSLVLPNFGGDPHGCGNETTCFADMCYIQGAFWGLSFLCLFWEIILICYAAYLCLKEKSSISSTAEFFLTVGTWLACIALTGSYIGVCVKTTTATQLQQANMQDRILGFVWLGIVFVAGVACIYLYFFRIKAYLHAVYISLFPQGEETVFFNETRRKIRRTIYLQRFRSIVSVIRPVVYFPFAFLLLTIPVVVYITWSEIRNDMNIQPEEGIMKGVCFTFLGLRGFVCVFVMFFLDRENRPFLNVATVLTKIFRTCCLCRAHNSVGFGRTTTHEYQALQDHHNSRRHHLRRYRGDSDDESDREDAEEDKNARTDRMHTADRSLVNNQTFDSGDPPVSSCTRPDPETGSNERSPTAEQGSTSESSNAATTPSATQDALQRAWSTFDLCDEGQRDTDAFPRKETTGSDVDIDSDSDVDSDNEGSRQRLRIVEDGTVSIAHSSFSSSDATEAQGSGPASIEFADIPRLGSINSGDDFILLAHDDEHDDDDDDDLCIDNDRLGDDGAQHAQFRSTLGDITHSHHLINSQASVAFA